jgi:hypothetical protein
MNFPSNFVTKASTTVVFKKKGFEKKTPLEEEV